MSYDNEKGLYFSTHGEHVVDVYSAFRIMDSDLIVMLFQTAHKLQIMELTVEEHAIIKAILLFSPG